MSSWTIPAFLSTLITRLQNMVDRRLRDLFPLVFYGMLFRAFGKNDSIGMKRAGIRSIP